MSSYFRNTEGHVYNSYDGKPWQPTDTPVTKKDGETAQREQAKDELRKLLKPGTTVYTILNHCSTSGMSRSISLAIGQKDGSIRNLDYLVATAKGARIDEKHGGLRVGGCGMNMGFHLVYSLGRTLWPNGTKKPHGTRNGAPDKDGGYALKHAWL